MTSKEEKKAKKTIKIREKKIQRVLNQIKPKLFVIAIEDAKGKSAEQYFDIFKDEISIKLVIIPNEDNKSSPKYILENLDNFKAKTSYNEDIDEFGLVFDIDNWTPEEIVLVTQQATQKDYFLAISNPCFELWLYLHIADLEEANMLELNNPEKRNKCKYCVDLIKVKLGSYSKKNLDIDKFKPYIDDAIERAKKLDINPYGKWPSQIGTHVYKLIESIKETKNKLEKRFQ